MGIGRALEDGHVATLRAMRVDLSDSMVATANGDSLGLTPQLAAQLLGVIVELHDGRELASVDYMNDLDLIVTTLAAVMDNGEPSIQAQAAGVLRKASGLLDDARSAVPQENEVDAILARKPTTNAFVSARRR